MSKNLLNLKHSIFILISFFVCTTLVSQKKQNILFIGVDDMRPLINSYGYPQMKTPNLDKLASEGVQLIKHTPISLYVVLVEPVF